MKCRWANRNNPSQCLEWQQGSSHHANSRMQRKPKKITSRQTTSPTQIHQHPHHLQCSIFTPMQHMHPVTSHGTAFHLCGSATSEQGTTVASTTGSISPLQYIPWDATPSLCWCITRPSPRQEPQWHLGPPSWAVLSTSTKQRDFPQSRGREGHEGLSVGVLCKGLVPWWAWRNHHGHHCHKGMHHSLPTPCMLLASHAYSSTWPPSTRP